MSAPYQQLAELPRIGGRGFSHEAAGVGEVRIITKLATGTRLSRHLLHEAGFKTDGNPIHLAGDFVVAVHQADGL